MCIQHEAGHKEAGHKEAGHKEAGHKEASFGYEIAERQNDAEHAE